MRWADRLLGHEAVSFSPKYPLLYLFLLEHCRNKKMHQHPATSPDTTMREGDDCSVFVFSYKYRVRVRNVVIETWRRIALGLHEGSE